MPYRRSSGPRRSGLRLLVVLVALVAVVVTLVVLVTRPRGDGTHLSDPAGIGRHQPVRRPTLRHRQPRHRQPRSAASASPSAAGPDWFAGAPAGAPGTRAGGAHHAVITVSSPAAEAVALQYAFRTAGGVRSGKHTTAGGSWSVSATVRGIEPLAGVVAQVGFSGSVTCTVSIDGHVTSRRTGSGRFATVLCAG